MLFTYGALPREEGGASIQLNQLKFGKAKDGYLSTEKVSNTPTLSQTKGKLGEIYLRLNDYLLEHGEHLSALDVDKLRTLVQKARNAELAPVGLIRRLQRFLSLDYRQRRRESDKGFEHFSKTVSLLAKQRQARIDEQPTLLSALGEGLRLNKQKVEGRRFSGFQMQPSRGDTFFEMKPNTSVPDAPKDPVKVHLSVNPEDIEKAADIAHEILSNQKSLQEYKIVNTAAIFKEIENAERTLREATSSLSTTDRQTLISTLNKVIDDPSALSQQLDALATRFPALNIRKVVDALNTLRKAERNRDETAFTLYFKNGQVDQKLLQDLATRFESEFQRAGIRKGQKASSDLAANDFFNVTIDHHDGSYLDASKAAELAKRRELLANNPATAFLSQRPQQL